MSRRQSLDRPGILSPPGPFLTPSPSPSISASPRLQPSPSLSPFTQDAIFVAGCSTQTNATYDHERKAVTPGRRQSIHQFANSSPNAGSIVFQPSPSQSPAAATTVIGVATSGIITSAGTALTNTNGNELNATLVGSNNIQLNKKRNKRASQQQESHFSHQIFNNINAAPHSITLSGCGYGKPNATTINTTTSFATTNMASSPKNQAKKILHHINSGTTAEVFINQQLQQYQSCSPLIADSPITSPSNTITSAAIKPPPQSLHMVQQQFTVTANTPSAQSQTLDSQQQPTQQLYQFIQGPQGQIIATHLQQQQHQLSIHQQQQTHRLSNSTTMPTTTITTNSAGTKSTKQILPKPQHQENQQHQPLLAHNQNQSKVKNANNANIPSAGTVTITTTNMQQIPHISQSPQPHQALLSVSNPSQCNSSSQQQQILLPTGATTSITAATQPQPLLLNQMPVLVQQNTSQGVQLILRPPTPQLTATPSLVIQNPRGQPQIHQQHPQGQQLLRIVGTNGATMQITAATPTFIVSSQANLIQQTAAANQLQAAIKSSSQTQPAISQLSGLQAALAAQTPRSQPFTTTTTINPQLVGQNMAAQLQNLQLAAAATANGNGITQIQMPNGLGTTGALISQLPAHLQQTLGGATINLNQLNNSHLQQIAAAFQTPQTTTKINSSSEIFTQPAPAQDAVAPGPEVLRQSTPVVQQPTILPTNNSLTTIQLQQQQQQAQIQHFHAQIHKTQSQEQKIHKPNQTMINAGELKKKSRQRKKKPPIVTASTTTTASTVETQIVPSTTNTTAVLQSLVTITPPTSVSSVSSKITYPSSHHIHRASNGKLDLGNVMKLCGITEDDDDDEDYSVQALSNSTHVSSDETVSSASAKSSSQSTVLSAMQTSSKDIMISIPNQNCGDGLPFTLTIPAPPSTTLSRTSNDGTDTSNFLIEIEQNSTAQSSTSTTTTIPPYTISIPRLPTAEEIQKQAQQHLAQQAAVAAATKTVSALPTRQAINYNLPVLQQQELLTNHKIVGNNNTTVQPTLSTITSTTPTLPCATSTSIDYIASTTTTTTTATTTAAVKPRRKPTARRNFKKQETVENCPLLSASSTTTNSISGSITTATPSVPISSTPTNAIMAPHGITNTPIAIPTSVPSQIGNIQISQVQNHQTIPTAVSNSVENKIQIMPIIDNTRLQNGLVSGVTATQLQLQPHTSPQLVFHPTNSNLPHGNMEGRTTIELSTDCRQVQLVAIPQTSTGTQASSAINHGSNISSNTTILPSQLTNMSGNVSISVGSPASTTALIPQLSGSLTLAVSEHCERLILRHDPNQPQDQQSQLILQALLKGALPNVTIINEPTKLDCSNSQSQQHHIPQVPTINKNFVVPTISKNDKGTNNKNTVKLPSSSPNSSSVVNKSTFTTPTIGGITSPQIKQSIQSKTTDQTKINLQPQLPQANMQPTNNNSLVKDQSAVATSQAMSQQQRYVALPKIDSSTHQLFCLNTTNNQITTISSGQTTASISSAERLLIAPAGINAQQLAQCLQQGQIHFNDVNPLQLNGSAANTSLQMRPQPSHQQVVHPVQPLSVTNSTTAAIIATLATTSNTTTITTTAVAKQVANVAPIIDQSKAKIEPSKNPTSTSKKKPIRKPKTATTSAEVVNLKNASVVKPMPKLDPLSQKHNNNPVQIVQPNVVSGKQVNIISTSANSQTSSTVTTTSNSIHPFNLTHSGTKLVGITAPMQQQITHLQQSSQLNNVNNTFTSNQPRQHLNNRTSDNLPAAVSSGINLSNIAFTSPPIVNVATSSHSQATIEINNSSKMSTTNTEFQTQSQQHQHTVSRVQTIQLTPQQQLAFKQVQMQIHYLTIKLQHKSLLSTLTLPPDFDHSAITTFNKSMTDAEINIALQRLFLEQQRILASGKEIPTPEALLPTPNSSSGFAITTQPQTTTTELSKPHIPANVVQPNNHSASEAKGNLFQQKSAQQHFVAQRIHIYPMQHHQNVQHNKQKQQHQQKSNQLQTPNSLQQPIQSTNNGTSIQPQKQQDKTKDINTKSKNIFVKQQDQIQNSELATLIPQQPKSSLSLVVNGSNNNSMQQNATTQPLHVLANNPQPNGNNNSTGPPPLIFPNTNNLLSIGSVNPSISSPSNVNPVSTSQTQQSYHKSSQLPSSGNQTVGIIDKTSIMADKPTPLLPILPTYISDCSKIVATVSAAFNKNDDISSPKPKIARLSLFVRQLEVDQESCFKPDCVKPFKTKEEAVKRLIRYHCMHENDENIPSDEEIDFEQTALKFKKRFCQLTGQFRQILLEESTLSHRTSESLQMQQFLIDDLKFEIDDLRKAERKLQQEWENNQLHIKAEKCELEELSIKDTKDRQQQYHQQSTVIFNKEKDEIKLDLFKDFRGTSLVDKFDIVKNSADLNKSYNKYQVNESMELKSTEKCSWKNLNDNDINNSITSISLSRNESYCQKYLNGDMKKNVVDDSEQSENDVKEFENFDIESELPPSFIMKKMESKNISTVKQYNMLSNGLTTTKNMESCPKSHENGKIQQYPSKLSVLQLLKAQNQQQVNLDDDWYCLQKELNLISSSSATNHSSLLQQYQQQSNNEQNLVQQQQLQQSKPLDDFGNNISTNVNPLGDILPVNCINESNSQNNHDSSNMNNLSCSQQRQQPTHQKSQNRHPAINEFFNTDSEVQKSVETRLEAMFGESPVPLDVKNGSDTQDIESNLDDIFGESKSSSNHSKIKNSIWDQDNISSSLLRNTTNINFDGEKQQNFRNRQTDLQSNGIDNQRWVHNMPNFGDFMSTTNATCESQNESNGKIRKRLWNTQPMGTSCEVEDDNSNKRLCVEILNSSSQLSHSQVNLQHSIIDSEILSLNTAGISMEGSISNSNNNSSNFSQLLMHHQQHQHHNFGIHQAFENLLDVQNSDAVNLNQQQQNFENSLEHHKQEQPQIQSMHSTHHIPDVNDVAEFDDDISRHVQNAIDSILNLQNNETDSLTFSLGSLLGDSILDDQRQQLPTNLPSCQQENSRQQQLVEDLGDCLISGGTNATVVETNNTILNESHQQEQQHNHRITHNNNCHHQNTLHNTLQQHTHHQPHQLHNHIHQQHPHATPQQQLSDFPCVTAGLDDGVKSILTS